MDINIRLVESTEEYHACESLQFRAWHMPDGLEVVPLHLLRAVQGNGGLLLGAFRGNKLVGFVFGFPGQTAEGKVKLCSHMMGVAPECQSEGVGYRLKLAQREHALRRGLDLVTWTYDPLEGRNAQLNIRKLGAICRTYLCDYYGPMADGLNAGLPSDRLQVEWWIAGERVQRRLAGEAPASIAPPSVQVNASIPAPDGFPAPGDLSLEAVAPRLWVEIPPDYQAVKAADPALAREWRLAMREVFSGYLGRGYVVSEFVSWGTGAGRRSFYLLSRDPTDWA